MKYSANEQIFWGTIFDALGRMVKLLLFIENGLHGTFPEVGAKGAKSQKAPFSGRNHKKNNNFQLLEKFIVFILLTQFH